MAILCFIYSPPSPTAFLVCKYVVSKEEKIDGIPILLDIDYRLCTYSNKYSNVSQWCLSSTVCKSVLFLLTMFCFLVMKSFIMTVASGRNWWCCIDIKS
ncbi:GTPase Der [Labeo rohita]|uniref:GTPase Der n=1 Tax=Labeo rohita TaxID=84645 RepID=A0ABQ8M227_LABRO|nr:GTPase Der [Labeo rohita]